MKKLLLVLAAASFAQPRITVMPQQDNSAPGFVAFRPLFPSTNEVRLSSPSSLLATYELKLPPSAPTVDGQCITGLTTGQLAFNSSACGERLVSDYNWIHVAGSPSPGTITVTFAGTSCPTAGADTTYKYRVFDAMAWEIVTSDGAGTCTLGGAGTITGTLAGSYMSASAESASAGWQEAFYSVAEGNYVRVRAGLGYYPIYSDILTGTTRAVTVRCDGNGAVLNAMADDLNIFHTQSNSSIRIDQCAVNGNGHSGITAVLLKGIDTSTFGGRIERMSIGSVAVGIHGVTGYLTDILNNRLLGASKAAMWMENIDVMDAGSGLIQGNNMSCASPPCEYGMLWNGPGAFQFKHNGFNGFRTQVQLEPSYGYATAVDSGADTIITWHDRGTDIPNNKFRPVWVGRQLKIGTNYCTIDAVTSDTEMRCNGENLGTLSARSYLIGTSGQIQVVSNLLDADLATEFGIRFVGPGDFAGTQIEGNFIINYAAANAKGISLEASGMRITQIKHNQIYGDPALTGTVGIDASAGSELHIATNHVDGYKKCIDIGVAVVSAQTDANKCYQNGTSAITNASSTSTVNENNQWTPTATGGVYRPTGNVGVNIALPLQPLDVFGTSASPATSGTTQNGIFRVGGNATNSLDVGVYAGSPFGVWLQAGNVGSLGVHYPLVLNPLGGNVGIGTTSPAVGLHVKGISGSGQMLLQDSSSTTSFTAFAEAGYAVLGTGTIHDVHHITDNVTRRTLTAAGMWVPGLDNTYDDGLVNNRTRVNYSYNFDGAPSGTTGNYSSTRDLWLVDAGGATAHWSAFATASATASNLHLKDNSGSRWIVGHRAIASSPTNDTIVYANVLPGARSTGAGDAVTDGTLPELGNITNKWSKAWIQQAIATDLIINTTTPAVVGQVWVATSTGGAGSWQAVPACATCVLTTGTQTVGGLKTFSSLLTAGAGLAVTGDAASDTGFSAITGAGDYGRFRKLEVHADGTGSNFFNFQFSSANVMDLLDTSSAIIARFNVSSGDISFAGNVWPAGTSGTRSSGLTTARWSTVNSVDLNLSGSVSSDLIPSGTRSLGSAVNPWNDTFFANSTVTSYVYPAVDNGAVLGDPTKRFSGLNSVLGNFTGLVNISSGVITLPTPITGTLAHIVGATGDNPRLLIDAFAGQTVITGRRANGVPGTPTAVLNTEPLLSFTGGGYGATGYSVGGRAGFFAIATENWTDTAQGAMISLRSTANGSTSQISQWEVRDGGHFVPGSHNTKTIGLTAERPAKIWTVDLDVSGTCTGCGGAGGSTFADNVFRVQDNGDATKQLAVELSGFTTATTNTLTPQNASYIIAGTNLSQSFSSAQTFAGTINVSGTVSSDLVPTSGSSVLGTGGTQWSAAHIGTVNAYTAFLPDTDGGADVGSTSKYIEKVWTNRIDIRTQVIAPSGAAGVSVTLTCGAGEAVKNINISAGIATSASCGAP